MPYLPESLAALRRQSFADFELVVCDNASTDDTAEVVHEFARDDPRIRYVRVDVDAGAGANFNRCVAETSGELFSWAASDDRFRPSYLERALGALSESNEFAMCTPSVAFVDENGAVTGGVTQPRDLSSSDVGIRLRAYLDRRSWYMVYGLVRRQALLGTCLFRPRYGPDVVLVWELLLRGRITTLDEPLLEYRRYAVKRAADVWRGLQAGSTGPPPSWPHVGLYRDLVGSCARPDLDRGASLAGRRALKRWAVSTPFRDLVVDDLRDELRRPGTSGLRKASYLGAAGLLRPRRALRNARRAMSLRFLRGEEPA
jgi:glycosyltransferase involved in cell wall biosynthesis